MILAPYLYGETGMIAVSGLKVRVGERNTPNFLRGFESLILFFAGLSHLTQ